MTATSAPAANVCDATCPCRSVTPIADPCACGLYPRGTCCYCETVAGGVTAKMPKSKAEDLAEWDAKMAAAVAKVPKVNVRGQDAAGTSPETPRPAVPHGAKRRAKTQRRTGEQVKRAAKRQMEEREALARKVSPDWLKEQIDVEEQFLASLKDSE
jgi:hypothetical protein